jgi:sigma-B regulation protein RsbU (phosphoserine phosphatase)
MIFDPVGSDNSSQHTGNPVGLISRHIGCAEIAAGNERTASLLQLPGLVAWVHSVPAGSVDAGGDVHYVSLCPSCIVSRIALADVSGHGQAVAALGEKLREVMQRHLRELAQVALMRDLNQAVREELGDVHYATMVAVGWHSRRELLVMTNAGHPPPLWYRAARQEWRWLETRRASERDRPAGVPLGLLDHIDFDRTVVKLQLGDLIVLYSDGVSEAMSPAGDELGRDGLVTIARGLDATSAEAFGAQLTAALGGFRAGDEPLDDQTLIVLRRENI